MAGRGRTERFGAGDHSQTGRTDTPDQPADYFAAAQPRPPAYRAGAELLLRLFEPCGAITKRRERLPARRHGPAARRYKKCRGACLGARSEKLVSLSGFGVADSQW